MGTPEFPDLGKHCAVNVCKQLDFLPFTCDRCLQVLCLDHRSYMRHDCPKGNRGDVTVVVCPFCATGVRLNPDEVPNIAWEEHLNSVCDDPSNVNKKKKKKKTKCPVPKCGAVLTFSCTIKCRDCSIDHCLKHRFGPDHFCPGPKKSDSFSTSESTKVATSAPASSSSSSRSSSLLASAEALIRKKRWNPTRVGRDSRLNRTRVGRDSGLVRVPWMIREGLVLTREESR
ncbi:PREDICTED: zinc finger AN1 and C2H2 domain-containing stress-associated protein 13 [Camelina sativa]|uniref:Zinc finger AN1 and C2H2 domain-containing stress-associated protein 13 n=1 Tax=Camelina sativa TaxID=90675 RepID=A0ABM0ZEK5_CAMSA|nr:PREDICTED: zinc finger AN1 and C2H2 domain-containing stress-associated protein 13 [Camelina sativa]XP_010514657.1 PREDICTED: zinc finger AN1 and C2H2 domain-containing stress-associated protein 13 [Camelina sativa]